MDESRFVIYTQKEVTPWKLRKSLAAKVDESLWEYEGMIPLDGCNMAEIWCAPFVKDRFQQELPQYYFARPCVDGDNASIGPRLDGDNDSLNNLNVDCLEYIFKMYLPLKDQISLAKVCRDFQAIVASIWSKRYRTLHFSLYDFLVTKQLTADKLHDFLMTVGGHVSLVIFDTTIFMGLIGQLPLEHYRGNMLTKIRNYTNVHMCRHLIYFENMTAFHIKGPHLMDFTVKQVSRHCRHLSEFKMLDIGSRMFRGKYLHLCPNLTKVSVKDCDLLDRRSLLRVSRAGKLLQLSCTDCNEQIDGRFITRLCPFWQNITTLKLNVNENDRDMLRTVLDLGNLKHLRLTWQSKSEHVELLLLQALVASAKPLVSLRFTTLCLTAFTLNRSMMTTKLRESNAASGMPWMWHDRLDEYRQCFSELTHLNHLVFDYCRPWPEHKLKELACVCPTLRSVKLIGCREESDEKMHSDWTSSRSLRHCALHIEGLEPTERYKLINRAARRNALVGRRVDCHFA